MKKSQLPSKICRTCNRPFTWRKKWERDWPNVKSCSKRCASLSPKAQSPTDKP
ncbi:DUF2256 domain-containing protein [Neptunomonas phycophila]|uniref:DUF2256 domain-containing protein n=1 Tax=Neptunomonas phycophila TaxID=1572645 RepID=UPI003515FFF1